MALITSRHATRRPLHATDDDLTALGRSFHDGDRVALRTAYEQWGGLVMGIAVHALGDRHEAEDVVQETFVAAWRNRQSFATDRGSLPSWLAGIARNKVKDRLRSRHRVPTPVAPDAQRPEAAADLIDDVDRVADVLLVRDALARLRPLQRRVLHMSFYDERPHTEIAAALGLPLGTVKSHARRGLQSLQRQLGAGHG